MGEVDHSASSMDAEHEGILSAILRRTLLRNVAKDSAEMERVVMASALDWTIARPPRLTNGPLTRRYGVSDDRMPRGACLTVSRADVTLPPRRASNTERTYIGSSA